MSAAPARQTALRVFGAPAALAAVSSLGLVGSLLTEGWPDILMATAVAAPLVAIVLVLVLTARRS